MKILSLRRGHYAVAISMLSVVLAIAALMAGMSGCGSGSFIEIRTWYDLNYTRNNLNQNCILMNDLDSTTAGYEELASPTANGGKGWDPIGGPGVAGMFGRVYTGTFDGNGHKICDLFINRPDQKDIGLFGFIGQVGVLKGVIENLGVVNFTVTGGNYTGGLVGASYLANTVTNCYATGTVTGGNYTGGLMGLTVDGSLVSISYFTGNVTGQNRVGGLLGVNDGGTVVNCYATGTVTGSDYVGGLVGFTWGILEECHSTLNVVGTHYVGGLVGLSWNGSSTVTNCYATGSVTGINSTGGLMGWSNGTVSRCWATGGVTGNGSWVGGLVGSNYASNVSNSYSTGSVTGINSTGGLMGYNSGNVSNSYSTGSVAGNSSVGGLVGANAGTVSNSFWDTQTSGQNFSAGGIGKNTTEMQGISTFSGAAWNIIAVASPTTRNPAYIWNIVNNVTYPFLSWQPVF
jgi:hypothetical protein